MVLTQKQKYIPMEQDRNLRVNPCTDGYLNFKKGDKNIEWGKDSLSKSGAGRNEKLLVKK